MKYAILPILFFLAALSLAAQHKNTEQCGSCHEKHIQDQEAHPHGKKEVGCDACHGPSDRHRDSNASVPPDKKVSPLEQIELCGGCHPAAKTDFESSKHGKALAAKAKAPACTNCHGVHVIRTTANMTSQCRNCHAALTEKCKGRQNTSAACASCHAGHTSAAKAALAPNVRAASAAHRRLQDSVFGR